MSEYRSRHFTDTFLALLIFLPRVFIWINAYTHITSTSEIVPTSTLPSHAQIFTTSLLFRLMI
ncbi:hypothetical protein P692DRAFT_20228328 [Suillus brevipes Sb2]|nr:hypothetical protein P692DRAFT_20228328 [Suillus brevipes Sb2]